MKKILSIDMDYFVDASFQVRKEWFPKGLDLTPEMAMGCWLEAFARGAHEGFDFNKIKMDKKQLEKLHKILDAIPQGEDKIPVWITSSHTMGYYAAQRFKGEDVRICNIDYHDDMVNETEYLGCGNWLSFLKEEWESDGNSLQIIWYAPNNDFRKHIFNVSEKDPMNLILDKIHKVDALDKLIGEPFDFVLLCRSDEYVPPILDSELLKLMERLMNDEKFTCSVSDALMENLDRVGQIQANFAPENMRSYEGA